MVDTPLARITILPKSMTTFDQMTQNSCQALNLTRCQLPDFAQESATNKKSKVSCVGLGAGLEPARAGLIGLAFCSNSQTALPADDTLGRSGDRKFTIPPMFLRPHFSPRSASTSSESSSIPSSLPPTSTSSNISTLPATSTSSYGTTPCRLCSETFCDTSTRNRHEKIHKTQAFSISCSACGVSLQGTTAA